jgi:hypothetical protein
MNATNAPRAATSPGDAARAVLMAEGELYAAAFLYGIDAGLADPDALNAAVTLLGGDMRTGFCRRLQQRLGERHG